MRNRWYEPQSGRFLSEDPIGLEGGINQYAFAGDNPVSGRDPTGLCRWVWDDDSSVSSEFGKTGWVLIKGKLDGKWVGCEGEPGRGADDFGGDFHRAATEFRRGVTAARATLAKDPKIQSQLRVQACVASTVSFGAQLWASGEVAFGGALLYAGVLEESVAALTSGIVGGTARGAFVAGDALIARGLGHLRAGIAPSAVDVAGVGGDVIRNELGWTSFIPIVGLPSTARAFRANCLAP
jgi:hypothetical protein